MSHAVQLSRIHHVAYRCKDAAETVGFYERVLGMTFTTAFAEDHVPSTGAYDPYMHVFLDCGGGNVLAFFELPEQPAMGRDANTPEWVQHIAFEVPSMDALLAAKAHLEAEGITVLGPTHHGIFKSIYFFDPNGHRLELAANIGTPEQLAELARVARPMLDEWSQTKRAPRHAAWLHAPEFQEGAE
ncbi:glyoxalase [Polymorphobacter multimanifer]|uniref:Catechol 2,3-dioxygenase-like lactoylglutathione lyase family enzyme n=1 Tax=Polymorphobacter multimanifer TaxID=1070431 RepID=A0A841L983_9SPHN|nr:VOC family protein [Polymorphobacter multimanifer]MBB6227523.1 catechol 2,3-dioxygenase-like lactoylglutathione lyase family enzyme [Polymorphobacter multimanifer]GGI84607.1 glyoxalase [Polymorphobacter multimanifer]